MGLLTTLGAGQGYLKAGFQGFQKSGKTYTAVLLAIGVRKHFGLDGPIAMFDTEGGAEYVAPMIRRETGKDLVGVRGRSFDQLMQAAQECEAGNVAVFIIDSISHIWTEVQESYLKQVNAKRAEKHLPARGRLEFQDWAPLKRKWAKWIAWYLNSRIHVIACGRAGYEYDFTTNEETGRKELIKTGTKMKAETEFGYEASLLVEMERVKQANGKPVLLHRATVIGDRFAVLDGKVEDNPGFAFFKPHIALLTPGAHAPVDTNHQSEMNVEEQGGDGWSKERRVRTILCEEIQGVLVKAYPGRTDKEKHAKLEAIESAFSTRSWTRVEGLDSATLEAGLAKIRTMLEADAAALCSDGEDVF